MNRVVLLVRRSPNYESGERCRFYSDHWQSMWNIDDKVLLWNRTFSMPYFEVRKRLYEIAFGDVDSLGFDLFFPRVDDGVMSDIESMSGCWVVAVDDDDWVSPGLASLLRGFDTDEAMCHWGAWMWPQDSIASGKPLLKADFRSGIGMVRSCAYAVRPFLGRDILMHHGKTKGLKGSVVEGVNSFYVRTPASVTLLKYHPENRIDLFRMWAGMRLLPECDVPSEFREKVVLLKGLFEECRPRRSMI